MKIKAAIAMLAVGAALAAPVMTLASSDADATRGDTKTYVKDSAITTKVKAKLAAEHLASLARIKVDTDAGGVVWLSGSAASQDEIDKAVSIAKNTEGVVSVKNNLKVASKDK